VLLEQPAAIVKQTSVGHHEPDQAAQRLKVLGRRLPLGGRGRHHEPPDVACVVEDEEVDDELLRCVGFVTELPEPAPPEVDVPDVSPVPLLDVLDVEAWATDAS